MAKKGATDEIEPRSRERVLAAFREDMARFIPNPSVQLEPGMPLRTYYDEVCRIDFRNGMDITEQDAIFLIRKRDRFKRVLGALASVGLAYNTNPPRIPEWIDFFGKELIPAYILADTIKMVREVSGEWSPEREFEARILTWVHLGEHRFRGSSNAPLPVPTTPLREVAVPDLVAMFDKWDFREVIAREMRADKDDPKKFDTGYDWAAGVWTHLRRIVDDTGLKIEVTREKEIALLAASLAVASKEPFTGTNVTIYRALATMELVIADINSRMRAGEKFGTLDRDRQTDREVWGEYIMGYPLPKSHRHLAGYRQPQ